jgi:RIO-like serine/threonine protein kinase
MQRVELSDIEQRVFTAVTALEARGQVPFPDAIADEAGLPEDQVAAPLHDLVEKNLVHREDSPLEGLDFGPRWCAVQPA